MTNGTLMKVKGLCILQYVWPALSFKTNVGLFERDRFRQVLLYLQLIIWVVSSIHWGSVDGVFVVWSIALTELT